MTGRSTQPAATLTKSTCETAFRLMLLGCLIALLSGSFLEFRAIASGTGTWYADFSLKWLLALVSFGAGCLGVTAIWLVLPWRRYLHRALVNARASLNGARPAIAAILVLLPILVLQYTPWGVVVAGPYLRILLWAICLLGLSWILCGDAQSVWTTGSFFASALVSGAGLLVGAAFSHVSSYPFSLGWSEGNRLWDYSLLFGKSLYRFDPGNPPVAYLDIGRQVLGGLPFIFPKVTILGARMWLAMLASIPYLLVGILAFYPQGRPDRRVWPLVALLGLLFLSQGPIHAPLVLCAILVLWAWRSPLGWGGVLLALAGFFAASSRFTWMFAPAMWAVMLELGAARPLRGRVPPEAWRRAIALGLSGLVGSAIALSGILDVTETSVASSGAVSSSQALLWYRLLPNATYADGILLGLLKATGPLSAVVLWTWIRFAARSRLQALVIFSALTAFLVVGLVVSTKIGGGGDLHNLDMFIVGLLLTAAILWHVSGEQWSRSVRTTPAWIRGALALSILIPAYSALVSLRPLSFASDADWISVLTDAERPRDLGSLPDAVTTEESLNQIRVAVADAASAGPILLMDQRQLLTFGYLQGVDLVPEYEKKRLMDEALSGNAAYFAPFYDDLAKKRFALIVSSPLRTPIRDSEYGFGEENNAWVEWVAKPALCYYRELDTLTEAKVELLVPAEGNPSCESALPDPGP